MKLSYPNAQEDGSFDGICPTSLMGSETFLIYDDYLKHFLSYKIKCAPK